jgi:4-hydroxy-4-methyl-2-oxoglutarate aldolase
MSAQGAIKETVGSVNVPIVCAGQHVMPGDIVIGDNDGVVIVPIQQAEQVMKATENRIARENKTRERLQNGELGVDIHNMRPR